MKEESVKKESPVVSKIEKKPGLFGRLFQKLDNSMKEKADEKAEQGSCCGDDGKGGKCC
ncbi:hypothetical protein MLD52_00845 [Puniceicoccaceae bacterium K14]|nr:hypothetical protein [Puniceicoccaceae bacterium K14]